MRLAKLFLPGDFEDALIHKGMLLAVTSDRRLQVLNFTQIIDDITDDRPEYASLVRMMFTGNHLLSGRKGKGFLGNETVLSTLEQVYETLYERRIEIDAERYVVMSEEPKIEATVVLDTLVYNDRLYIGTSDGCYQQDLHFRARSVEPKGSFTRRIDARCMGISAGFGTLNLSCGNDGLQSFPDEFDWDPKVNPKKEFTELSGRSSRTSWIRTDLMNYPTGSDVELLRGDSSGGHSPNRRIVELTKEQVPLDNVLENVRREQGLTLNDVQFVFNSERAMFFHTFDGHFFGVELKWGRDRAPVARLTHSYKGSQARILSTQICGTGLVIETMDRLLIFSSGMWYPLLDEEAVSVRTLQNSSQYKNMVLIVTEAGLHIVSTFNDAAFRLSQFPSTD